MTSDELENLFTLLLKFEYFHSHYCPNTEDDLNAIARTIYTVDVLRRKVI